jgi:hypothetical protein
MALAACSPEDTGTFPSPGTDDGGFAIDNGDEGGGSSSSSGPSSASGSGASASGSGSGSGGVISSSSSGSASTSSSSGSVGADGGAGGSGSGSGSNSSSSGSGGGMDAGVRPGMDASAPMEAAATLHFATNIAPIVNPTCRDACHGGCGGLTIAYANIVNVKSGEVPSINYVTPSDPGHSYLWCKVNPTDTDCVTARTVIMGVRMPADGPPYLSASNLTLIKTWILQGAAD